MQRIPGEKITLISADLKVNELSQRSLGRNIFSEIFSNEFILEPTDVRGNWTEFCNANRWK